MSFTNKTTRSVYVVDGKRTPFLKVRGTPGAFSASDLAVEAGKRLMASLPVSPESLDEVIVGNVFPDAKEMNIARVVSLRMGCGKHVPAYTVARNCASGMQAIDSGAKDIAIGRSELVLVGGTEAMSRYPILHSTEMVVWLGKWARARSIGQRLALLFSLRPAHFRPVFGILLGLTDHVVGLSMGQTAENLAKRFSIDRHTMDEFAVASHLKLAEATDAGDLEELIPVVDGKGNIYDRDDGVRPDSTTEKLKKLRPVFDKKLGQVTAGNSAQVTDGAAMLLLASEEAVKKYRLPVLGRVVDFSWAGLDPAQMGLGPVHAMADLLIRNNMTTDQIDVFEINEAFAAQVIACIRAWNDPDYMRTEIGEKATSLGELDTKKLNLDGGAISIGHPVGASGARLPLHLLKVMQRKNYRYGVASLCIGGGQGGAILLERTEAGNE